jgi:hypothetical protein
MSTTTTAALLLLSLSPAAAAGASFRKVTPGGGTNCAKGAPFAFYYRQGSVNKVVIEFQGGGACWNAATCAGLVPTYTTTAEPPNDEGIHSDTDARNPFKGWHHLFVPYCTADAHGGNKTTEYEGLFGKVAIHHVGRVNAFAALDYVFANGPQSPDVVATVGCSAGSLGGIINAPYVFDHYPDARTLYFGDSYVGVISTVQFKAGLENWDLQFDPMVKGLDKPSLERVGNNKTINAGVYIINATLSTYPKQQFASYTSNDDAVQSTFFTLGAGIGSWVRFFFWGFVAATLLFVHRLALCCGSSSSSSSQTHSYCISSLFSLFLSLVSLFQPKRMRELTTEIHAIFPGQYATFIAPGTRHCRTQDDGIYTVKSDNVMLSDWIMSVVAGAPSSRAVDCEHDGGRC